jgi:hypothetical protein
MSPRELRWSAWLMAAALLAGHGKSTAATKKKDKVSPRDTAASQLPPAGEEIVFEVRHCNYAWGATNKGFFVNARGQVKRFDYFDAPGQSRYSTLPPKPTHADLLKSFGAHPEVVSVVPAGELVAKRALVSAARDAPLACASACADAGGTGFEAWVVDKAGVYSKILLVDNGDIACRNLSPVAGEIAAWLQKITGMRDNDCRLPDRACTHEPCAAGLDCFSPDWCRSVLECSWCRGEPCVEGPDGSKHCTMGNFGCADDAGCSCHGDAICPGGKADCRELADGSLTCRH